MLTREQRKEVYEAAERMIAPYPNVELDALSEHDATLDPVEDGIWVRAWVRVPSALLTNYSMEPPAPPSSVAVESTKTDPFPYG